MNIDETIERLRELRNEVGNVEFCVETSQLNIFEPAGIETISVAKVIGSDADLYACLYECNTTEIVVAH